MSKGSGGTRTAGPSSSSTGGLATPNRYESDQKAVNTLKYNQIHTTNIFDAEDVYSAQDKIIAVTKTNEFLRENLSNQGIKVGSLAINADGSLEISSLRAIYQKGADPRTTTYIDLRVDRQNGFIEAQMHGFKGGPIKWRTERLDNIREQAKYMVAKRYDSSKYDRNMELHVDPDTSNHGYNKASHDTRIADQALSTVNGKTWWGGRPNYKMWSKR